MIDGEVGKEDPSVGSTCWARELQIDPTSGPLKTSESSKRKERGDTGPRKGKW